MLKCHVEVVMFCPFEGKPTSIWQFSIDMYSKIKLLEALGLWKELTREERGRGAGYRWDQTVDRMARESWLTFSITEEPTRQGTHEGAFP